MARKTQARKQRMHSERVQRKAAKARARRAEKPNKNVNSRRSSGPLWTPRTLPAPMLAAMAGMAQFFAAQQIIEHRQRTSSMRTATA